VNTRTIEQTGYLGDSAFFVGVLSANPVVEAVGGWKAAVIELNDDISDIELFLEERSDFWEFLEESGEEAFESQVYEVSVVSVIPAIAGTNVQGNPVQLRCLDGDWVLHDDPKRPVVLSTGDLSVDDLNILAKGNLIEEIETSVEGAFLKTIGYDGFAERASFLAQPFEITVTMTILCLSPSP